MCKSNTFAVKSKELNAKSEKNSKNEYFLVDIVNFEYFDSYIDSLERGELKDMKQKIIWDIDMRKTR